MRSSLFLICCALLGCTQSTPSSPSSDAVPVDRDNTANNVRDKSELAKTPIDQHENREDLKITATIRSRVVDAKISINGQNVKIITQNGKVTLRGPVKSEEEKKLIESIAIEVAGADNVQNLLDVEINP